MPSSPEWMVAKAEHENPGYKATKVTVGQNIAIPEDFPLPWGRLPYAPSNPIHHPERFSVWLTHEEHGAKRFANFIGGAYQKDEYKDARLNKRDNLIAMGIDPYRGGGREFELLQDMISRNAHHVVDIFHPMARNAKDLARLSGIDTLDYAFQIGAFLLYFEKLEEVDVRGVEATIHPIELRNHWREDEERPSFSRREIGEFCHATEGFDYRFKVPPVLDTKEQTVKEKALAVRVNRDLGRTPSKPHEMTKELKEEIERQDKAPKKVNIVCRCIDHGV